MAWHSSHLLHVRAQIVDLLRDCSLLVSSRPLLEHFSRPPLLPGCRRPPLLPAAVLENVQALSAGTSAEAEELLAMSDASGSLEAMCKSSRLLTGGNEVFLLREGRRLEIDVGEPPPDDMRRWTNPCHIQNAVFVRHCTCAEASVLIASIVAAAH